MPRYTAYPKELDTPNRKSRKSSRNSTFVKNKVASRLQRKARKEQREARLAAEVEELEETVQ